MPSNYDETPVAPTTDIGTLKKRVKYKLGWPLVKLEITDDQISEQINYALRWFYKHATGTATKRKYLVFWLIPGQQYYTLPAEVIEVTDYTLDTSITGINTLFTLENYLWNYGFLNFFDIQRGQFTLLSYHLVLNYIETLRRYVTGKYLFQFNKWTRQLFVQPDPDTTNLAMIEVITKVDSDYLYDALWVEDYTAARCKYIIGEVRSKYSGATLPGIGATLNGDTMKSEALEEMQRLEERLMKEDAEGYPVMVG